MSYKKDAILEIRDRKIQIRDREQFERLTKKMEKRLSSMTEEERNLFLQKLTDKLNIVSAQIRDCEELKSKLENRERYRMGIINREDIMVPLTFASIFSCAIAGTLIGGLINPAGSIAGGLYGALSGLIIALTTGLGMEFKVVSNAIAKIRAKINSNKMEKLQKKQAKLEKTNTKTLQIAEGLQK